MIESEARLGLYPRQRNAFGLCHPQWRLIARNHLILKVAPDNVGVRCGHFKILSRGGAQCLVNVGLDVFNVLQSDGEPDVIGCDASFFLFRRCQLLMRG